MQRLPQLVVASISALLKPRIIKKYNPPSTFIYIWRHIPNNMKKTLGVQYKYKYRCES